MPKRKGSKKECRVANELKKRGYKIEGRNIIKKLNQHKKAEYDLIVRRGKYKYAIEVKCGKQTLTSTTIEKHIKKSNKIRARPVFVIGRNVKLTDKAKEVAKKNKVRIEII